MSAQTQLGRGEAGGGWTGALRRRAVRVLPPDKLLPDTQPKYVASWIYVFGVLTLAAFLMVRRRGVVPPIALGSTAADGSSIVVDEVEVEQGSGEATS